MTVDFDAMLLQEVIADLRQLDEVTLLECLDLTTEELIDYLMPHIEELVEEGRL